MSRIAMVDNSYTTSKIQKIIDDNDIIYFIDGVYAVTSTIWVASNKTLYINNAILQRQCSNPVLCTYSTCDTKQYNGASNILIIGGVIEGINTKKFSAGNLCYVFHANGVSFIGTEFRDAVGSHCIDIVGSKNTNIHNCKFNGYKSYGADFRESIQIDFSYYGGLPYFGKSSECYDDTHCENIAIINCKFNKSNSYPAQYIAIGSHTQTISGKYHNNIEIGLNSGIGNGCSGYNGYFIKLINARNINIYKNTVSNYGRFVLCNTESNSYNTAGVKSASATCKGCSKILIQDNVVTKPVNKYRASSVYLNGTESGKIDDVRIIGNTFDKTNTISCNYVTKLIESGTIIK